MITEITLGSVDLDGNFKVIIFKKKNPVYLNFFILNYSPFQMIKIYFKFLSKLFMLIGPLAHGQEDRDSIPGRVISKT